MGGVESYVITDNKGWFEVASFAPTTLQSSLTCSFQLSGIILRQSKGISSADAVRFASEILKLASRARHVIRDLDPKVSYSFLYCFSNSASNTFFVFLLTERPRNLPPSFERPRNYRGAGRRVPRYHHPEMAGSNGILAFWV